MAAKLNGSHFLSKITILNVVKILLPFAFFDTIEV